jgi:HlyD family secretion protein
MTHEEIDNSLSSLQRPVAPAGTDIPLPHRKWKSRVLVPGILLLVTAGVLAFSMRDMLTPQVEVEVYPAVIVDTPNQAGSSNPGEVVSQATGWVQADPYSVYVSALTDGILQEVRVLAGQSVKKGQVIATMIDEDARLSLQHTQAQLQASQASLRIANAALAAAKDEWAYPVERQRAVNTAGANLIEAQAQLKRLPNRILIEEGKAGELKDAYERVIRAQKQGAGTNFEVQQAKYKLASQKARVEATRQHQAVLEAKVQNIQAELKAATRNLELRIIEKQALEAATANVQKAQSDVALAKVRVAEAKLGLSRMKIVSPMDGVVIERKKAPGEKAVVMSDNPHSAVLLEIYDPAHQQVRVDVPLNEIGKISVGQAVEINVKSDPSTVYHGKVTRLIHEADIEKNTLEVKVSIEKPGPLVKPQTLARVKFLSGNGNDSTSASKSGSGGDSRVLVPAKLIHDADGQAWTWVVGPEKRARRRELELGDKKGNKVIIRKGLRAGDRLVAKGPSDLSEGSKLNILGEMDLEQ